MKLLWQGHSHCRCIHIGKLGNCHSQQTLRLTWNCKHQDPANPAGLQVQCTIGRSDYAARDGALKVLIQALAGEYGMHNGEAQGASSLWPACLPSASFHSFAGGGVQRRDRIQVNCNVE